MSESHGPDCGCGCKDGANVKPPCRHKWYNGHEDPPRSGRFVADCKNCNEKNFYGPTADRRKAEEEATGSLVEKLRLLNSVRPIQPAGITLRQWYAGQALMGDFGNVGSCSDEMLARKAREYLKMADALIAAEKSEGEKS